MADYIYRIKIHTPYDLLPILDNAISAGFCFIGQRGKKIHTVKELLTQAKPVIAKTANRLAYQIPSTTTIEAEGFPMTLEWSQKKPDELIITSLPHQAKKEVDLSFYKQCALKLFKGLTINKLTTERLEK